MKNNKSVRLAMMLCVISLSAVCQKKDTPNMGTSPGREIERESPPGKPPVPLVSSNTYGPKTLICDGAPPTGTIWYWQTVSAGTSMNNSNSKYTVIKSGTYYLRAFRPSSNLWSSGTTPISVIVNHDAPAKSKPQP